jgi:hypothetical protein
MTLDACAATSSGSNQHLNGLAIAVAATTALASSGAGATPPTTGPQSLSKSNHRGHPPPKRSAAVRINKKNNNKEEPVTRVLGWGAFKDVVVKTGGQTLTFKKYFCFFCRLFNAALVHATEAVEQALRQLGRPGAPYVHDTLTENELCALLSACMTGSIGRSEENTRAKYADFGTEFVVRVSCKNPSDKTLFERPKNDRLPLGTVMAEQNQTVGAICYLQLTRALNGAFVKLVNCRMNGTFRCGFGHFDSEGLQLLVAAAFDRAPPLTKATDLSVFLVLRMAIEDSWPQAIKEALLSSGEPVTFQVRLQQSTTKTTEPSDVATAVANWTSQQPINAALTEAHRAKLGPLNAWFATWALNNDYQLVGSTPLGLFGQQRTGCPSQVIGDLDVAVPVADAETPHERAQRRAALIDDFKSFVEPLTKEFALNVSVEQRDVCVHVNLTTSGGEHIAKVDLCDGAGGQKSTLPLASALNGAARVDNGVLVLAQHRHDPKFPVAADALAAIRCDIAGGVVDIRRAAIDEKSVALVDKKIGYFCSKYFDRYELRVDGKVRTPFSTTLALHVAGGKLFLVGMDTIKTPKVFTSLCGLNLLDVGALVKTARSDVLTASHIDEFVAKENELAERSQAATQAHRASVKRNAPVPARYRAEASGHVAKKRVPTAGPAVADASTTETAAATTTSEPPASQPASTTTMLVTTEFVLPDEAFDDDAAAWGEPRSKSKLTQHQLFEKALWHSAPHDRGLRKSFLTDAMPGVYALCYMQHELSNAVKEFPAVDRLDILGRKSGTNDPLTCTTRLMPCLGGAYGSSVRKDPILMTQPNPLEEMLPLSFTRVLLSTKSLCGADRFGVIKNGIFESFGLNANDGMRKVLQCVLRHASGGAERNSTDVFGFGPSCGAYSMMPTKDGLHVQVCLSEERQQRAKAASVNSQNRVAAMSVNINTVCAAVEQLELEDGDRIVAALRTCGDADLQIAKSTRHNGGVCGKWQWRSTKVTDEKFSQLVGRWLPAPKSTAVPEAAIAVDRDEQQSASSSSAVPPSLGSVPMAVDDVPVQSHLMSKDQLEQAAANAKVPAGESDVFRSAIPFKTAHDAIAYSLQKHVPKCAVRLEQPFTAADAVELNSTCSAMFGCDEFGVRVPSLLASTTTAALVQWASLLSTTFIGDFDARTRLSIIDPGAAGFTAVLNVNHESRLFLNFDKSTRAYYGAASDAAAMRRFKQHVINALTCDATPGVIHITVIGGNFTDGMHEFIFELLRRGHRVLIVEETGSSRNCAVCTGELTGAKATKLKYMCPTAVDAQLAKYDEEKAVRTVVDKPAGKVEFAKLDTSIRQPKSSIELRTLENVDVSGLIKPKEKSSRPRQRRGGVTETELRNATVVDDPEIKSAALEPKIGSAALELRSVHPLAELAALELESVQALAEPEIGRAALELIGIAELENDARALAELAEPKSSCERQIRVLAKNAGCDRVSLRALSRFLKGAFRHKWTPELKVTAKRCRYLVVLAVGRGELAYNDAWSISLEAAAALDASLLLATAHKPMDVLRTASHIDWTTYPAWLEQDKTNAQNRPKRHGLTLWDRAPKGKMGMTDATGERDRQYWSKAKFLSTAALGRKVHSMVTRARCATCLNNEQRCDRCRVERLLARAPELACVGLGHYQCTKTSKIVPGNTMRIEHTIVQWRQRVCAKERSPTAAGAPENTGCGRQHHRDVNAVSQFCAILVIDALCGGRSKSFCRSPA